MQASSAKLNVLGVYECDKNSFLGEVHSFSGEEMVGGWVWGGG